MWLMGQIEDALGVRMGSKKNSSGCQRRSGKRKGVKGLFKQLLQGCIT